MLFIFIGFVTLSLCISGCADSVSPEKESFELNGIRFAMTVDDVISLETNKKMYDGYDKDDPEKRTYWLAYSSSYYNHRASLIYSFFRNRLVRINISGIITTTPDTIRDSVLREYQNVSHYTNYTETYIGMSSEKVVVEHTKFEMLEYDALIILHIMLYPKEDPTRYRIEIDFYDNKRKPK